MGVYTGAKCRLCRREGDKLFLKGARCYTSKCAFTKREHPPGKRSFGRRKTTPYGIRMREKQKLKRIYGLREEQFRVEYGRAEREKGNTGENLLVGLERRLDNVIYWSGLALSRRHSRLMAVHHAVTVNGERVDIPSYKVKAGDVVRLVLGEKQKAAVAQAAEATKEREAPMWLVVNREGLEIRVDRLPKRDDVKFPIREQLIVELSSR